MNEDAMLLGDVEEGADGDAGFAGTEAVAELFITLGCFVPGMKLADPMGIITTGFTEVITEGEENAKPGVVGGGDVDLGGFYLQDEGFDV